MNAVLKVLNFIFELLPSLIRLVVSLGSINKKKETEEVDPPVVSSDEFEDPR